MRNKISEKERKKRAAEAAKRWNMKHPEKVKDLQKKRKEDSRNRRAKVINHYGNKCACCGETEIKFLAMDHINGGGKKHRFDVCSGSSDAFYRWLYINRPDFMQVLCHNCNLAKGFYGSCPHKEED